MSCAKWRMSNTSVYIKINVSDILIIRGTKMIRRITLFIVLMSLGSGLLAGCGGTASASDQIDLAMASMSVMPTQVQNAPLVTQQAYQFAVANSDIMQHIPCYCGCGAMGHTSNYSCYVNGVS